MTSSLEDFHSGPEYIRRDRSSYLNLDINLIDPNPEQPRRKFLPEQLAELTKSIQAGGVLQPIIVTRGSISGRYVLIAGERRLRASQQAGLTSIPAVIKDVPRGDWLKLALVENIQRADLNCIEEALAYEALIKEHGLTQDECAVQVGKERSTIANFLRILKLPKKIQEDLADEQLSLGHGRAILSLPTEKLMFSARNIIIAKNLSVRNAERLCQSLLEEQEDKEFSDPQGAFCTDLEQIADSLRGLLKTKVRLSGSLEKGRIEISYFSSHDLDRLLHFWRQTHPS